jgi:hypothetical protein
VFGRRLLASALGEGKLDAPLGNASAPVWELGGRRLTLPALAAPTWAPLFAAASSIAGASNRLGVGRHSGPSPRPLRSQAPALRSPTDCPFGTLDISRAQFDSSLGPRRWIHPRDGVPSARARSRANAPTWARLQFGGPPGVIPRNLHLGRFRPPRTIGFTGSETPHPQNVAACHLPASRPIKKLERCFPPPRRRDARFIHQGRVRVRHRRPLAEKDELGTELTFLFRDPPAQDFCLGDDTAATA